MSKNTKPKKVRARPGACTPCRSRRKRYCESCVLELDAHGHPLSIGGECERCGEDETYPLFEVYWEPAASDVTAAKLIEVAVELLLLRRRPPAALQTAIAMTRLASSLLSGGERHG